MADPNKFEGNFLSLLDDFKPKRSVNKTVDGSSGHKQRNVAVQGEFSGGSNKDERACKNNPNRALHLKRQTTDKSRSSKEENLVKHNTIKPEEKISNEFFSILDSFDNKQAINKNQVVETEYKDYSCGTKEGKIHFVESDSKTSTRKNNFRPQNFRNEREIGLDNSKKDCISDRGRRPNISGNTDSTSMRNENIQENRETKIQEKRPRRTMGYKFLESLLNKDTSFVLTTLASPRSGFQELVDERPIRADLLMLIFKVLNKINESEAHQIKVQILSNTFRPEFIDELKKFVSQICVEENRMRLLAMNTFFVNVLNVLDTVANSLPTIMNDKFKSTLNALNLAMKSLREEHKINVSEQLFIQLKELTDQVSSYIEHSNKMNKEQRQHHLIKKEIPPPNNYRGLPLVPTEEDFMTDSYLRQNIVRGSYKDVDHYLDIQFRLLREDFIHPLREGILEYVMSLSTPQAKRRYSNVRIYPKVQFENPFKSRDVFGFYIQFDFEKRLPRNTNWEYNKRFMPGSLLLFTDNNFQSFYLATVVERKIEKLKEGLLFIQFVPGTDIPEYLVNPGVFFVMAESEVYYEAYKHVLSALQRMNENHFPMKQYIVDVDTTCFPPEYLVDNSIYKISKFDVNLLDENSWPSPDELKLNPSQHQALKSALTNEFVVIQGPPGTGKTFLALKITEILLKNKVSPNTPIVVICYTNHALDQFLEGILKYTKSLIRIGMQSQNETLQKYTLEETRKRMNGARNTNYSALFRETRAEKLDAESKLLAVKANIEELTTTSKGILELQVLRSVVPPHQYNELIENHFLNWLFCYDDPEFRTKETSFVLLPEATDKTPETPEQLIKEAGNVTDVQGEAKDGTDNPGEDFEEIDEEESARRLADMKEDDFYDEDLFQDDYYVHSLSYSLTYDTIDRQIEMIREDCITRPHENSTSEYYFKLQCNELIEELIWQRNFLRKQFSRLGNFRFNRQRLEMFQQARSVWEINALDRWEYYYTWVYLYICQLKQVVQHFTKIYQDALMKLYELRQLEDLSFVQSAAVLGLTTSGAAKRRVLLENLGTKIVIVEEAAEVLEAHIVTSLAPTVQHVILIGDHKQLKPNPAVFKLAKKYNMDCSLFERMLNNGLGCSVLNEQHRMRPEIASLITPTIYPHLANHPSTLDRPRVRGVDRFIFFLSHNKPEDQMPDSTSKQNKHEADLLMELCKYLLLNDYKPEEITILATYIGQVWYMRKKKREMGEFMKAVRITPVDNFQGEENRIILLSLVRSNKENKIGFLSTENRVCVALSRAREGLYVVGNMDNLTNSSSIWPKIKQQLEDVNGFG